MIGEPPLSHLQLIGAFIKLFEPVFWAAQVLLIINLINPRGAFDTNLKVINWLLKIQGFDKSLSYTKKAFKTWRRDVWILCFLNLLIIVLIHLI